MLISVKMPKATLGENPMLIPPPHANGLGSVTVLCGPNGSGKSYLLRSIKDLVDGKTLGTHLEGHGWGIETTGDQPRVALRPKHHKAQMTSVGAISMEAATKKLQINDDEVRLKVDVCGLLLSALEPAEEFDPAKMDVSRWGTDTTYRGELLSKFPVDEERVYFVRGDCPDVLQLVQREFGARLGFRNAPGRYEAVLAWPHDMTAPYDNWSDGQKSLFTILMSVAMVKPDIYLFDELENFFHPLLISRAIELLKQQVKQIVLTSHHPHMIFGRAVDRVYYVELGELDVPLYANKIAKTLMQPSPPRRITHLTSNLEKLANAYRLFDMRDAALLASASYVQDAVDLQIQSSVRHLFQCHAAPAKGGVYVDRQTEEIANYIAAFHPSPAVVLDWGAGLARTAAEMEKGSAGVEAAELGWLLYEPVAGQRERLEHVPHLKRTNARVLGSRNELADVQAGVALLTNVLHAIDPELWVQAFEDCWRATKAADNGVILVTEIYPLLAPEKDAVPIPREIMEDLFATLGFKTHVRAISIHNAVAYCLAASQPPAGLPPSADLLKMVEAQWHEVQRKLLRQYEGAPRVQSAADKALLMNAAFGIARVASWFDRAERTPT